MLHFLLYVDICDKISAIKFVYWQASFVAFSPVTNIAGRQFNHNIADWEVLKYLCSKPALQSTNRTRG